MGYVLKDVYDVKIYDAKTNEFLFGVTSALDNELSIEVQDEVGTLALKHCYFEESVLDEIGKGKYKNRQLRLELVAEARESETGEDRIVKTIVHNGLLVRCEYVSNKQRFMVNNLLFQIVMADMTNFYQIDVSHTPSNPDA